MKVKLLVHCLFYLLINISGCEWVFRIEQRSFRLANPWNFVETWAFLENPKLNWQSSSVSLDELYELESLTLQAMRLAVLFAAIQFILKFFLSILVAFHVLEINFDLLELKRENIQDIRDCHEYNDLDSSEPRKVV